MHEYITLCKGVMCEYEYMSFDEKSTKVFA